MDFETIVALVKAERERQDAKWGVGFAGRADAHWHLILSEEVGELANAVLEHEYDHAEEEAIQVAAVVFSWLEFRTPLAEQVDPRGGKGTPIASSVHPELSGLERDLAWGDRS